MDGLIKRRAITQASRQAAPAELTTMTFSAQDATKEKLSLRVADPTASRGLVHRHVVLIQQNARQVRDRSGQDSDRADILLACLLPSRPKAEEEIPSF
jgi:hypothetical protein